MQQTETIWTTLVGDHPTIIPVEFSQSSESSLEEEMFKWKCWCTTDDAWRTTTVTIAHHEHFVLCWAEEYPYEIFIPYIIFSFSF